MQDPLPTPPERAFDHAPLKPWSPYDRKERAELRAWFERLTRPPYLTGAVIAVLVFFHLVQLWLGWPLALLMPDGVMPHSRLWTFYVGHQMGVLDPALVWAGEGWRLVSATMLHASLLHLAGNCIVLFGLGRIVENVYGPLPWLACYVGAGLAGTGLATLVGMESSLGASGAVLGLLGATVTFGVRYRKVVPRELGSLFGLDLWVFVVLVGLTSMLPFVDWAGHLGGFLFGVVFALIWPARALTESYRESWERTEAVAGGVGAGAMLYGAVVMVMQVFAAQPAAIQGPFSVMARSAENGALDELAVATEHLQARFPDRSEPAEVAFLLLLLGEHYAAAADLGETLEQQHPLVRRDPMWDNNLAWALLRGHPDDPKRVREAIRRARRSLRRLGSDPGGAVRNTLAWGLFLDGRVDEAEAMLAELVGGSLTPLTAPQRVADNAFMHVITLVATGRVDEAAERYRRYAPLFPEGLMREEARSAVLEAGGDVGREPTPTGEPGSLV